MRGQSLEGAEFCQANNNITNGPQLIGHLSLTRLTHLWEVPGDSTHIGVPSIPRWLRLRGSRAWPEERTNEVRDSLQVG